MAVTVSKGTQAERKTVHMQDIIHFAIVWNKERLNGHERGDMFTCNRFGLFSLEPCYRMPF